MHSHAPSHKKAFWLILVLALMLRLWHLNLPFVEPYNSMTRQTMVAEIARNFYEHGFNFFNPEIDEGGKGPYLFNGEVPVTAYLAALLYRLTGGVHEWAARLVSVLFSMGTIWIVYLIALKYFGERAALLSMLFLTFSPLNLAISRAVQPDAAMLFFSTAAIVFMDAYTSKTRTRDLVLSMLCAALAIATKIQCFYISIVIFYLIFRKDGWKIFRNPAYYVYLLFSMLPLVWYAWMWHQGQVRQLAYTPYDFMTNRGPAGLSYWGTFAWPFSQKVLKYFLIHILTPLGILGLFFAFIERKKDTRTKSETLFIVWLGASLFYVIFFWRFLIDHSYYQIPIVACLAVWVGSGLDRWWDWVSSKKFDVICSLVTALFLIASLVTCLYFYRGIYSIADWGRRIVAAGHVVDEKTPKNSYVIASYLTSPVQLYHCHRKGWVFDFTSGGDQEFIERFEKIHRLGAQYFVTTTMDLFHAKPVFERYLRSHYTIVEESGDFIILALESH